MFPMWLQKETTIKWHPQKGEMMPLFKFMECKWAAEFVLGKSVRIGSLSYYRNIEMHPEGKADPDEGNVSFRDGQNRTVMNANSKIARQLPFYLDKTVLEISPPGKGVHIGLGIPNGYVFSLSMSESGEHAKRIDSTYDACVAIERPIKLVKALTLALRYHGHRVSDPIIGPVEYENRVVDENGILDPSPFKKGTRFKDDN